MSLVNILGVTGICFVLDAVIVSQLSGNYRAERAHYILALLSAVVYFVAYFFGPETYRNVWVTAMVGRYIFDMAVIIREWSTLKKSYRRFFTVHHIASFLLVALWRTTFNVFTPAMAIASLIWLLSDVYRWADQVSRLGGRYTPAWVDRVIFWLERSQRILAYLVGIYAIGFHPQHIEEVIFLCNGIMMDVIDTWFQVQAASARKAAAALISEICKGGALFKGIDNARLDKLGELMSKQSYAAGEVIVRQGEKGESMFVILEGTVSAYLDDGTVLEQLTSGDIGGEMSLLAGDLRNASMRADTAVKIGVIIRKRFLSLIASDSVLHDVVWRNFAARTFNLQMRDRPEWAQLDQTERLAWFQRGNFLPPIADEEAIPASNGFLFVITGAVENNGQRIKAPALISRTPEQIYQGGTAESLVMMLPSVTDSCHT